MCVCVRASVYDYDYVCQSEGVNMGDLVSVSLDKCELVLLF